MRAAAGMILDDAESAKVAWEAANQREIPDEVLANLRKYYPEAERVAGRFSTNSSFWVPSSLVRRSLNRRRRLT